MNLSSFIWLKPLPKCHHQFISHSKMRWWRIHLPYKLQLFGEWDSLLLLEDEEAITSFHFHSFYGKVGQTKVFSLLTVQSRNYMVLKWMRKFLHGEQPKYKLDWSLSSLRIQESDLQQWNLEENQIFLVNLSIILTKSPPFLLFYPSNCLHAFRTSIQCKLEAFCSKLAIW